MGRLRVWGVGHSISEIAVQLQHDLILSDDADGHSISEIAVQLQLNVVATVGEDRHSISEIAVQLQLPVSISPTTRGDRKSTRLNSSHKCASRMQSSA